MDTARVWRIEMERPNLETRWIMLGTDGQDVRAKGLKVAADLQNTTIDRAGRER